MSQYDIAIVGGGAAGLSAALVLCRARREVVVVDSGVPRNGPAAHLHGYLSRDGLSPVELLATGRREVRSYGGDVVADFATDVKPDDHGGFCVALSSGRQVRARRLLITTGLRDELPDIPGLADRWARDVLHCPYCHGYEVRDHKLGVIGGNSDAVTYAQIVRQWTHNLVYLTPADVLTDTERAELSARGIGVAEGTIDDLVIDDADQLRGVRMGDGCVVPLDALFVPPRFVANSPLLLRLGCHADSGGWVTVDHAGRTSVDGVWAAGNVVDPRAQVITAAGAGSAAAVAINADLVVDDVRRAVAGRTISRRLVTPTTTS